MVLAGRHGFQEEKGEPLGCRTLRRKLNGLFQVVEELKGCMRVINRVSCKTSGDEPQNKMTELQISTVVLL